jgi:antitoxin component HigA of HigAB toxin-antitoxin module
MRIKPIKTETDYDAALKEIERIFRVRVGITYRVKMERTPNHRNLKVAATFHNKNRSIWVA